MTSFNILDYATQKQIKNFKPTFIYIKQHSITGKLYLGKTTRDVEKYLGSGIKWTRHIKKHGTEHVVNIWYSLFHDIEQLVEFALSISETCDILNPNSNFMNCRVEDGLMGGATMIGRTRTKETNQKQSKKMTGRKLTVDHRNNIANALTGVIRGKNSKPTVMSKLTCPHCGKTGGANVMQLWHFDNCGTRPTWIKTSLAVTEEYKKWSNLAKFKIEKHIFSYTDLELQNHIKICQQNIYEELMTLISDNANLKNLSRLNLICETKIDFRGYNKKSIEYIQNEYNSLILKAIIVANKLYTTRAYV